MVRTVKLFSKRNLLSTDVSDQIHFAMTKSKEAVLFGLNNSAYIFAITKIAVVFQL